MTDAPPPPRTRRITAIINWRRLAIAAPVLIAFAVALYVLLPRRPDASTPRAVLADTPAAGSARVGVHKGDVARDFSGTSPDGKPVRLSELRGKPVIINFWATWCASCLAEMPDLKAVQQEIGADHLTIVAVNTGEDASKASGFLKTLDAPDFRVVMDPTLVVADTYGVFGLSDSVFVDGNGVVRAVYAGQLSRDLMRQYVAATVAGEAAPAAPRQLRLLGSVEARKRVLEVHDRGGHVIRYTSKSLRCDDSYCARDAVSVLGASVGVPAIDQHLDADPPYIDVTYEPRAIKLDDVTVTLAGILNAQSDPLYEGKLTVEMR